jgi:hypothetical protein
MQTIKLAERHFVWNGEFFVWAQQSDCTLDIAIFQLGWRQRGYDLVLVFSRLGTTWRAYVRPVEIRFSSQILSRVEFGRGSIKQWNYVNMPWTNVNSACFNSCLFKNGGWLNPPISGHQFSFNFVFIIATRRALGISKANLCNKTSVHYLFFLSFAPNGMLKMIGLCTATDTGIVDGGADESPPQVKNFLIDTLSYMSFIAFSEEEHWLHAKGFYRDELLK